MSPSSEPKLAFTAQERTASMGLASVIGLRMLGLFLMLPVLAIGAGTLSGGHDPVWLGLAMGAYGLTQAVLQIPFGMASDRWGRRPIILAGLGVFVLGSMVCALASSIELLVLGRALQGAGAVSAAVSAYLSDLTRESVRTRAMAIVGAAIGLSFALSMVIAPPLFGLWGLAGLFAFTAALALVAMAVVLRLPTPSQRPPETRLPWSQLLGHGQLQRLNLGIFTMMAIQTSLFVAIPQALVALDLPVSDHWQVYLPLMLLAFALMVPPIIWAERKGRFKPVFLASIGLLVLAMVLFLTARPFWTWMLAIAVFMLGFNLLEALLPSWVSRLAPTGQRGQAMGVYNTSQSLGLFVGGLAGGLALSQAGLAGVFWLCGGMALFWGMMSLGLHEIGPRTRLIEPEAQPIEG
ncbi:MAG: MFS transporter [Burkholderiaceae bacterium]